MICIAKTHGNSIPARSGRCWVPCLEVSVMRKTTRTYASARDIAGLIRRFWRRRETMPWLLVVQIMRWSPLQKVARESRAAVVAMGTIGPRGPCWQVRAGKDFCLKQTDWRSLQPRRGLRIRNQKAGHSRTGRDLLFCVVRPEGVEPSTLGLKVPCSTN